jgi:site-specific recombinase XerD
VFDHYATELLERGEEIRDLLDHESVATTPLTRGAHVGEKAYTRTGNT